MRIVGFEAVTGEFEREMKNIVAKCKISEAQAGCYLCNYGDKYICDTYNGGCKSKSVCDEIDKKLKE